MDPVGCTFAVRKNFKARADLRAVLRFQLCPRIACHAAGIPFPVSPRIIPIEVVMQVANDDGPAAFFKRAVYAKARDHDRGILARVLLLNRRIKEHGLPSHEAEHGACRHGECGFFLRGCFRLCLRFRCICLHRRFRCCVRRLLRLQNDLRFLRRGFCADRQTKKPRQRRSLRAGRQATQQRQRKQQTDGTFHRTFPHPGKFYAFSITQFFLNLRRRNS